MSRTLTPLGLRLSIEPCTTDSVSLKNLFSRLVYDPVEGLNKVKIENKWIPAVHVNDLLGTETITETRLEVTDHDYHENRATLYAGTQTYTKENTEDTDSDFNNSMSLMSTSTHTYLEVEATDEDIN